ncbi:ATP-binding cassette sub- A member 1 [Entomortierella chlamydospora]|uniref:ATP-binding cassette sub- A member 1 n=1 Tax=Entomortierella chlamydospora TaxID=101097 RepID=A0A9P6MWZ4_9FUNG|nr:ATP-binding cassette sub- A member 1 [Entomortierella chlamydospora]KAG0015491.1 ATP-binding cassette sub- A member 1 [Entomortierella chlamydospora]
MSRDHNLPYQEADSHSHHLHSSDTDQQRRRIASTAVTQSTSHSTAVVYASARQSSSVGRWLRQLGAVCRLNCILLVRYWKAAILQAILLPLLAVGIVYAIQSAYVSDSGKVISGDTATATWTMDGIHQCKPEALSNACMTVVYAPLTPETTQIMSYFQTKNQARTNAALTMESNVWSDMSSVPKENMGIVPMASDQFIYDYSLAHPDTIQLGVVFTKETPAAGATGPIKWNYQVYYNMTHATNMSTLPGFKYTKEAGFNRISGSDDAYGALLPNMVRAIDEALLTFIDPQHQQADLDYSLRSFPTVSNKNRYSSKDDMVNTLSNLMALPACITMVMAMLRVIKEKESKCKESMRMMGLDIVAYWSGHWLTSWIMALVQAAVIVALGHAFQMDFFTNSNGVVLWLMFSLLAYSMTVFGLFLTTFCQKTGAALGFGFAIVVAVLVVVPVIASGSWVSLWIDTSMGVGLHAPDGSVIVPPTVNLWVLTLFFPFLNFARLWGQISSCSLGSIDYNTGNYTKGSGFNFTALTTFVQEDPSVQDLLPQPASAFTYFCLNVVIIALLTLYFDQVIPNEHSRSRGVFFFFGSIGNLFRTIRHGGSSGVAHQKSVDARKVIPYEGQPPENEDSDVIAERERAVSGQGETAIRISNLTKTYTKSGHGFFKNLLSIFCCCCVKRNRIVNKAVDRLNLITEPNELFALLGQNGAGKSTTMQMLYGVTNPTSGDAFLHDQSIRSDMQNIRATMGVCPQHDVLFNDLTCWEHMQLYAGIKDLPAEALLASNNEQESVKENTRERPTWIRSRLEAVQLWKDRNTMAGRLSGGMKRRLSTIISTIGDPDVLILDEPTTGMDPIHRRHVWTFLAQFKRGRSILLTTHSMEEADALGDKVAIMVSGHLKAIGNTTRLKNKFGNGYRVEIALGGSVSSQKELEQEVTDAARSIMPESTLLDQSGGVMVFGIPMQAINRMADLTAALEKFQAQDKIKNWGIAQTSLEEVFLSLVRSAEDRH